MSKRGLFLIGVVAIASLLLMLGVSALGFNVELSGTMYDAEGKKLYPTEGDNFWIGKEGRYDMDPSDNSYLVAKTPYGEVVGTGRLSALDYEMDLFGPWQQNPVMLIYAGFYDPVRHDRTTLLYCTSVETSRIPYARKVFVDITCENIVLFEGTTGAYR